MTASADSPNRVPLLHSDEWFRRAGILRPATGNSDRLYLPSSVTVPIGTLISAPSERRLSALTTAWQLSNHASTHSSEHASMARSTAPSLASAAPARDPYQDVLLKPAPASPPPAIVRKSASLAMRSPLPLPLSPLALVIASPTRLAASSAAAAASAVGARSSPLGVRRASLAAPDTPVPVLPEATPLPFRVKTRSLSRNHVHEHGITEPPSTLPPRSSPMPSPEPEPAHATLHAPSSVARDGRDVFVDDINRWHSVGFHFNGERRFPNNAVDVAGKGMMYDHWQSNAMANVARSPLRYSAAFDSKVQRKIDGLPDPALPREPSPRSAKRQQRGERYRELQMQRATSAPSLDGASVSLGAVASPLVSPERGAKSPIQSAAPLPPCTVPMKAAADKSSPSRPTISPDPAYLKPAVTSAHYKISSNPDPHLVSSFTFSFPTSLPDAPDYVVTSMRTDKPLSRAASAASVRSHTNVRGSPQSTQKFKVGGRPCVVSPPAAARAAAAASDLAGHNNQHTRPTAREPASASAYLVSPSMAACAATFDSSPWKLLLARNQSSSTRPEDILAQPQPQHIESQYRSLHSNVFGAATPDHCFSLSNGLMHRLGPRAGQAIGEGDGNGNAAVIDDNGSDRGESSNAQALTFGADDSRVSVALAAEAEPLVSTAASPPPLVRRQSMMDRVRALKSPQGAAPSAFDAGAYQKVDVPDVETVVAAMSDEFIVQLAFGNAPSSSSYSSSSSPLSSAGFADGRDARAVDPATTVSALRKSTAPPQPRASLSSSFLAPGRAPLFANDDSKKEVREDPVVKLRRQITRDVIQERTALNSAV